MARAIIIGIPATILVFSQFVRQQQSIYNSHQSTKRYRPSILHNSGNETLLGVFMFATVAYWAHPCERSRSKKASAVIK